MLIELYKEEQSQSIRQAVAEHNAGPLTPELVTETFRTIWQVRGDRVGMRFEVPDLPCTQDQLDRITQMGRRFTYVPQRYRVRNRDLNELFPSLRGQNIPNEKFLRISGWTTVETTLDAPNCEARHFEAEKVFGLSRDNYFEHFPIGITATQLDAALYHKFALLSS